MAVAVRAKSQDSSQDSNSLAYVVCPYLVHANIIKACADLSTNATESRICSLGSQGVFARCGLLIDLSKSGVLQNSAHKVNKHLMLVGFGDRLDNLESSRI